MNPSPSRLVLFVATRKGAWLFHGDPKRDSWSADGPHFLGHNISHVQLDPRELPLDLVDNVRRMKFRGVSAKVNFALDALPVFPALPDTVDHYGGFLNIGPTIEYVERAFDAASRG